jgi:serine/threonine-protein kinase
MVTGRRAFEGRSGISTLSSILRDDVRPIAEAAPDVPQPLEQIILRCLPKDPAARWQSMKEIEAALTALLRRLDPAGQFASPVHTIPISPVPIEPANAADGSTGEESPGLLASDEGFKDANVSPPPIDANLATTGVFQVPAPPSNGPTAPAATVAAPKKARPAPAQVQRSAKFVLISLFLIGAVLVASAGIGGWWWWKMQHQSPKPVAVASVIPQPATPTPPPAAAAPAPETVPPPATPEASEPKPVHRRKSKVMDKTLAPIPAPPPVVTAPPTIIPPPPIAPPPKPKARPVVIPTIPVSVSDALPFEIILGKDVPADEPEGFALTFTVPDGLKVGDKTVIAKGATVTGVVTGESNKKGFLGIGGGHKMQFRLIQATAVDGKKIAVRALPARNPDGLSVRSLETGKGSKAKGFAALQGALYIAYVDGDQIVAVRK